MTQTTALTVTSAGRTTSQLLTSHVKGLWRFLLKNWFESDSRHTREGGIQNLSLCDISWIFTFAGLTNFKCSPDIFYAF